MGDIVSLHGDAITPPGEPVPSVVEWAEELLERARSGEVKGIACAVLFADNATGTSMRGALNFAIVGRMQAMSIELIDHLED